jgi:hypothetical protein
MIVHLRAASALTAERREAAPPGGVEVGVAWKAIIELEDDHAVREGPKSPALSISQHPAQLPGPEQQRDRGNPNQQRADGRARPLLWSRRESLGEAEIATGPDDQQQ